MFDKAYQFSVNDGMFNNVETGAINVNTAHGRTAIEILSEFTKGVGAAHYSASRHPPPRCYSETRQEIKDDILQWCRNPSSNANVFWVHGPAGVGKSAIAQTIAELVEETTENAVTRRTSFRRMAYQLACRIPELNVAMTKVIHQDPGILYSSFDVQFRVLLVNSYRLAIELHGREWIGCLVQRVIVIDGIDECETWGTITQRLLRYRKIGPQDLIPPIAFMLVENLPFRFLLFSRPEPRIREALEAATFDPHMRRLGLGDSWGARLDIRKLFDVGFSSIRGSRSAVVFPEVWPAPGVVDKLVDKACGQFIYAATVLKFVNDEYSQPMKQLSIVLGFSPAVKGNSPFKDLDMLYHQILSTNPDQRKVVRVLRTLIRLHCLKCHRLPPNPKSIEKLLGFEEGEVSAALRGMHSVLEVGDSETNIDILHVSFNDFLHDKSRSCSYYVLDILSDVFPWRDCSLRRMLAEPVMFGCLWRSTYPLFGFYGSMWSTFHTDLVRLWQGIFGGWSPVIDEFLLTIVLSLPLAFGMKTGCPHANSGFGAGFIGALTISYLVLTLIAKFDMYN
ncbi:nwd2 [Moniliophthora roreri]|nr:nwd2 [Moniliophthora roreri]